MIPHDPITLVIEQIEKALPCPSDLGTNIHNIHHALVIRHPFRLYKQLR